MSNHPSFPRLFAVFCLALIAVCAAAGCGEKPGSEAKGAPSAAQAQIDAILARADQVDGTADHVVSQCPGCQLHMPGTEAHAIQAGEYALHFCSEDCKSRFGKDLDKSVLALAVPEETPAH
jgi:hypothetical protein